MLYTDVMFWTSVSTLCLQKQSPQFGLYAIQLTPVELSSANEMWNPNKLGATFQLLFSIYYASSARVTLASVVLGASGFGLGLKVQYYVIMELGSITLKPTSILLLRPRIFTVTYYGLWLKEKLMWSLRCRGL